MAGGDKVETALIEKRVFGGPKIEQREAKNGRRWAGDAIDGGLRPPRPLKRPLSECVNFSEHQLREAVFAGRRRHLGRAPPTGCSPAPGPSDFWF